MRELFNPEDIRLLTDDALAAILRIASIMMPTQRSQALLNEAARRIEAK